MKKQIAILLLLCYSLALVKPLAPALSDLFAHSFWKTEHLASVHYENGKYHLHIDMEKAGKEDPQNNPKKASEKNDFVHLNPVFEENFIPGNLTGLILACKQAIHSSPYRLIPSPPPWSC
ncbi:MAG: hypothetical protein M3R17_14965 [Bacteroidota bacterium]|nr:hypothetical protein [Bacteroidota bacterium]